jgi:hypothetical protein
MPHRKVNSLRDLRTLKLRLKPDDGVQITKAGGFYKARFRGRANCVLGGTAEEAASRLRSAQSKAWKISPREIHPIEQQLMESLR